MDNSLSYITETRSSHTVKSPVLYHVRISYLDQRTNQTSSEISQLFRNTLHLRLMLPVMHLLLMR